MIVLNFSHILTEKQLAEVERLAEQRVERVLEVNTHFDHSLPFVKQIQALVEPLGFSSQEWQTTPLLVNPPSLSVIAALLLAELHGRMGYFPAILRLRPDHSNLPTQFEVAEILNLQAVRDAARKMR